MPACRRERIRLNIRFVFDQSIENVNGFVNSTRDKVVEKSNIHIRNMIITNSTVTGIANMIFGKNPKLRLILYTWSFCVDTDFMRQGQLYYLLFKAGDHFPGYIQPPQLIEFTGIFGLKTIGIQLKPDGAGRIKASHLDSIRASTMPSFPFS